MELNSTPYSDSQIIPVLQGEAHQEENQQLLVQEKTAYYYFVSFVYERF